MLAKEVLLAGAVAGAAGDKGQRQNIPKIVIQLILKMRNLRDDNS